jgi:hypothetical protein
MQNAEDLFAEYRKALAGLSLGRVWRGYGSALFLEFGALSAGRKSPGQRVGQLTAMIEWSWRIERGASIICGSWSDEGLWQPSFDRITGATVIDVSTFGRLPELQIALTDDLYVASFMAADGDPAWALVDHRPGCLMSLGSSKGRLQVEDQTVTPSA